MAAAAPTFPTEDIRNVAVVGHGGSGKTTLVDAMCYLSGSVTRKGDVNKGTALTDFTPEETEQRISLNLAVAHAVWSGTKTNLIDTPGFLDFFGEAVAGIRAADAALCVIDAVSGVQVGTERAWEAAAARGLPRMIFVSVMDRDNASFRRVYKEIRETIAPNAIPVIVPIGSGRDFRGFVDLISMKAYASKGGDKGECTLSDIPDDLAAGAAEFGEQLVETAAAADDELLEAYLEGEQLSREQIVNSLARTVRAGEVVPVLCGSGASCIGVPRLLDRIVELLPSPNQVQPQATEDGGNQIAATAGTTATALVFKTTSEPHVGDLSLFRVFGGGVTNGQTLLNPSRGGTERIAHIAIPQGARRVEVEKLMPGDIGMVAKLRITATGDTLCDPEAPATLAGIDWPAADLSLAVQAKSRGDEDRISAGLAKVHAEDPTFTSGYDAERGQTIIRGLGEIHLGIALARLTRKYGVEVETEAPRVAYRETITRTAQGHGRFKKQSGGRGQFGDCHIRLSPLARGEGYEFVNSIKGGVIPGKFVPAVSKGIEEAARKGILAGYPLVDFKAECYDGTHHSVDSSDIAFQVAGSLAFQKTVPDAGPVILEPILEVEIETPEENMGEVMGDLNSRRGRVLGMDSKGKRQVIRAHVPQAEMHKYSAVLRSITGGRAFHTRKFHAYEPAPAPVAEKVVAQARDES